MSQTTATPTTTNARGTAAALAPTTMARVAIAAAVLAASAGAQSAPEHPSVLSRFEFIVSDGALLPTGDQRDALKNARMNLAQLSYAVRPYLAVTTSMGWARTRDIASVNEQAYFNSPDASSSP